MASLPGFRFDITGTSGTQGLLTPKASWRAYVLPRGGYASADSTGTTVSFDSTDVVARFATNDWVQVGLNVDNIRQVSATGGVSIQFATAVTASENDRVFLIGTTQPTVTGGSATYTTPATTVRERDDDTADIITNSQITSDSNGLIQGFAETNFYDVIIQDGNQANQGSIINMSVGIVEGVSVSSGNAALFGDTVTVNGQFGVTSVSTFGSTVTINAALGGTGHAVFGVTATVHGALGVTGHAVIGATCTIGTMVDAQRFRPGQGTALVDGDFSLSAGWGIGASIAVGLNSHDAGGFGQVTAAGTPAPNPTITLTHTDGAWPAGPDGVVVSRAGGIVAPTDAYFFVTSSNTTTLVIGFQGTPIASSIYTFRWVCIG